MSVSCCALLPSVMFFVVIADPAFDVPALNRVYCDVSLHPAFGDGLMGGVPVLSR